MQLNLSKSISPLIGVVTLFSVATFSNLKATTINLPLYGFRIDSLDAQVNASPDEKALTLFLPESDGFQPSINVLIQSYNGTIKDYVTVTSGQFEQLHYKLISQHLIGDNAWSFEYNEPNDVHCYAQAVLKNGKVYLATAIAKESQWATVGDTLRMHIDGFKTTSSGHKTGSLNDLPHSKHVAGIANAHRPQTIPSSSQPSSLLRSLSASFLPRRSTAHPTLQNIRSTRNRVGY